MKTLMFSLLIAAFVSATSIYDFKAPGLSGGTITTSGTLALANVGITAGSYTWPTSLNINAQGQVIGASAGSQPFTTLIAGTGISLCRPTCIPAPTFFRVFQRTTDRNGMRRR